MDLYKWAYKLTPATPSELLADCFALAVDVRELDMRASPYDLSAWGYEPVRIETAAGRAEYARAQAGFAERAAPLRTRLLDLTRLVVSRSRTPSPPGPAARRQRA
ncbi:MAG: 3-methyladenine DNA glycosylase, partial [Pseudonocardia sp.]|nr:3-methyladenine DNA glycosylase [Pseudonocardia sp.]